VFKLGLQGMIWDRNDTVLGFQSHRLRCGLRQQQYSVGSNSMTRLLQFVCRAWYNLLLCLPSYCQ